MHAYNEDSPQNVERSDWPLTDIDPLLRASLQRQQRQRRRHWYFIGGTFMFVTGVTWFLASVFLSPQTETPGERTSASPSPASSTTRLIARADDAAEVAQSGWQLWQSGDGAAAEKQFVIATELDPTAANHWNGLGWSRMQQAKYAEAAEAFAQCVKLSPQHPGGLNGAGQAQLQLGNLVEAEKLLLKAAAKSSAARFGAARVQLLLGKFAQAERSLRSLTKADAQGLDADLVKAMRAAAKNKTLSDELRNRLAPSQAAAPQENPDTDTTVEESPDNSVALNAQGWTLLNQGKPRPAELAFRAALRADRTMLAAKNGLGFALLNQDQPAEAETIFAELVSQTPTHPGFVNGWARSMEQQGKLERAVQIWRTVEKADGPVTACTWGLARTLMQLERWQEALPLWERISQESPDDETVKQMLAKCREAI